MSKRLPLLLLVFLPLTAALASCANCNRDKEKEKEAAEQAASFYPDGGKRHHSRFAKPFNPAMSAMPTPPEQHDH